VFACSECVGVRSPCLTPQDGMNLGVKGVPFLLHFLSASLVCPVSPKSVLYCTMMS
jgi:hypothetical protein